MAQPVLNITILGTFIDNDTPEKKHLAKRKKYTFCDVYMALDNANRAVIPFRHCRTCKKYRGKFFFKEFFPLQKKHEKHKK